MLLGQCGAGEPAKLILIVLLVAAVMQVAYFAGTLFMKAKWFTPAETQATTNQKAAVSAAKSLLFTSDKPAETIFLPLITK